MIYTRYYYVVSLYVTKLFLISCNPSHSLDILMPGFFFGMKRELLPGGGNAIHIPSSPTPLDAVFRPTPVMGALGFFQIGTYHIQAVSFSLTLRILFTARRDGIVRLKLVILFVPTLSGIVGSWGGNIQITIGIPPGCTYCYPWYFPYLYRGKLADGIL
jgi:hypothetical protein